MKLFRKFKEKCKKKEDEKVEVEDKVQEITKKDVKHKLHLIVDDSDINREVMKKYLRVIKEKSECASSGEKAIKMALKKDYTFIWIDVRMPEINGIDATKQIRADGFKNIILGVTGQVDYKTRKECLEAGMNDVLTKPVFKETLFQIIEKYSN